LVAAGAHVVVAGLGGAVVGMLANGLVNRTSVQRRTSAWAQVAVDHGVQASLVRLASAVGADRAFVLPPGGDAFAALPACVVRHAVTERRPLLITEAAS